MKHLLFNIAVGGALAWLFLGDLDLSEVIEGVRGNPVVETASLACPTQDNMAETVAREDPAPSPAATEPQDAAKTTETGEAEPPEPPSARPAPVLSPSPAPVAVASEGAARSPEDAVTTTPAERRSAALSIAERMEAFALERGR